jgi:SAM-dependent methyltransferase
MLKLLSPGDAGRLRDYLMTLNFTSAHIRDDLGLADLPSCRLRNLPRLMNKTEEPTALHTLLRWFLVGTAVETRKARELIPDWAIALFCGCGLLVEGRGELIPTALLLPFDQFFVASDHPRRFESGKFADLVLWPNPTSRLLSRFTIRRPSRATLDLGSGNGIESLHAAEHSEKVVAADLNPRATEYAAFNARLNGIENIECVTGDLFEPVQGRSFDLIVSNPPFFISPSNKYLFCDNPYELDELCRKIARAAPGHLNEGGYFQMLCEWAEIKGQPWQERVAEWFEGSGCDVWILKGYTQGPAEYAEERIRETTPDSPEGDAATYARFMEYYHQRKVEAIHNGLIAMRRRPGHNWIRIEEISQAPKDPFGDSVLQTFSSRDFLDSHPTDEMMLTAKPRLSASARLEQRFEPSDGGWQPISLELRLMKGFPFHVGVQPLVAEFLSGCDGEHTLGELIQRLSGKVNVSAAQVQQECLDVVRKLIERGFVLP